LSACSWFHGHSDYYTKAQETRPLEVPPDLDRPPSANELVVPQGGSGAAASSASAIPPSGVVGAGENELRVADTVAGTWQRVGVALDRAKIGTVSGRDEATHSYTLDVVGPAHPKPESERHWYTPVLEHLGFGEEDKDEITRHMTVRVGDDSAGARVSVAGEGTDVATADATRRIVQALRENLATSAPPAAAAPVAAAPMAAPPPAAAAAPAAAPAATTAPPAITGASLSGMDLRVADSVQSTWQRVGIALERAQIGTLSGRDENAHTYTLAFSSSVETPPGESEHHWYTRILHPFGGGKKTEQVQRNLVVRVVDDSGGSRVSVEGDAADKSTADAARRVVEVLRDRLS
jgi:uncharacterized lipoprotein